MGWELYDPQTTETYEFSISPSTFSTTAIAKNVSFQPTAHGKRTIAFQGRNQIKTISMSGTILDESEYFAIQRFANKRSQIRLTDDLDRVMWIYITSFSPQRQLHPNDPFYFSYSLEATILDWQ